MGPPGPPGPKGMLPQRYDSSIKSCFGFRLLGQLIAFFYPIKNITDSNRRSLKNVFFHALNSCFCSFHCSAIFL